MLNTCSLRGKYYKSNALAADSTSVPFTKLHETDFSDERENKVRTTVHELSYSQKVQVVELQHHPRTSVPRAHTVRH